MKSIAWSAILRAILAVDQRDHARAALLLELRERLRPPRLQAPCPQELRCHEEHE